MKYNFKPYTTTISESEFYLPPEVIADLEKSEIYIFKHPDGPVTISDSEYINNVVEKNVFQNEDNSAKLSFQRYILSKIIAAEATDEIVACLTNSRIGLNIGDTVTVESGNYSIVLKICSK